MKSRVIAGILCGALATPAGAQSPQLGGACEGRPFSSLLEARDRCLDVAAAVEILQPEAGLLLAGANPVLGTASPLGTRGGVPRATLGARFNFVFVDVPNVFEAGAGETLDFVVPLPQADFALGLFSGFSSTPTLGGLGALDLVASAAVVPAVEELSQTKVAWGVGGRLGILRESFVLPGASVSVMYKKLGRIQVGDLSQGDEAEFGTDLRSWSVRGALSKSFLTLGLSVGAGWDRYRSDIDLRFVNPVPPGGVETVFSRNATGKLETDRWMVFGEVGLTFGIVSWGAQLGFQERATMVLSDGTTAVTSGGLFGGIGLRLAL